MYDECPALPALEKFSQDFWNWMIDLALGNLQSNPAS